MMVLARNIVVYLLFVSMLYIRCTCDLLPRSCGTVKESLGIAGNVLDSFTPGKDLQCKLNHTCCSSELENKLMESNKYKQKSLFLSLLVDSVDSCFTGGAFESSIAEVIASEETDLVRVISSTFNEHFAPHRTIFNDFYTYLAEIPRTLDMCALNEEVHKVMFRVYRATIATASNNEILLHQPEAYQRCLYDNFFLTQNSQNIHKFYKIFEKNFARLWYFLRSRQVLLDVMNELVKYFQFSDSCNTALLHATDCAKCSGYANVQVCKDLCMNLFRGCLVDFKEVGSAYDSLYSALKSLENQMKTIFSPDRAFTNLHSQFLTFITPIATASAVIDNIPPVIITEIISKCGQFQQVPESPTANVGKREVDTDVTLVQLVQTQMKCFDKLDILFDDIDSKMCEANNATSNNNNCWNGKEIGSYDDELLDATRIHQQRNPKVIVSSRPSVAIIQLRMILETTAKEIRYLLSEEICVPDDEDDECVQPDDYCNIPIIPVVEVDYSGSGEPPTIDFTKDDDDVVTPSVTAASPATSSAAATTSSSQVVVAYETNTPSGPTGPTVPPEWTADPITDPDLLEGEGGASSIHHSLYILLLLSAAVLFLC